MFPQAPIYESFQYAQIPAFQPLYGANPSYTSLHEALPVFDQSPSSGYIQPRSHSAPPSFISEASFSFPDASPEVKPSIFPASPSPSLAPSCESLPEQKLITLPCPSESETIEPAIEKHIPRPPNAFMLYRSDFLKKGIIPLHVERRQQNLSRVVGECWNLLSEDSRREWHVKAAEARAAHYKKYPGYKFKPARGKSSRAKDKARQNYEGDNQKYIRDIREQYTRMGGPAPKPPKSRKSKASKRKAIYDDGLFAALSTPLPPSISSTPALSPLRLPTLPVPFPEDNRTYGGGERPVHLSSPHTTNTTYGNGLELKLSRPSSSAGSDSSLTDLIRDLDITPTAATFQHNTAPPPPNEAALYYDTLLGLNQLRLPFHSVNQQYPLSLIPGNNMGLQGYSFDQSTTELPPMDFLSPNVHSSGPSSTSGEWNQQECKNSWFVQNMGQYQG
ncbi:hypothetical protein BJ138DRAFT_1115796 [Hygrophoropsis aurantiaca]|uniref:Uncharacterized protein n=1 Tax=Hygrophoropsis aurantiaca TaxID=72124 RepID=A0ACB8A638_9AGAM|nr:hypothetical protein BJ138DRAFT_1115796 [Hygrophoropsis aurantiaca]